MTGSHVAPPLASPGRHRDILPALLLILAIGVVYAGVSRAGFVWDDDSHLTANPRIIGPEGLKEVWTSASANYFPLVLTNLWLQHQLWGLTPLPYHAVNVALHAINAVLVAFILRRLSIRGAWLGAAFWALHPVQVESVAWISEMKNTQSAMFYLLTILWYLRWRAGSPGRANIARYALMLTFAAGALLSKPSTVMLPAVLLLVGAWLEQSWSWRRVWPTIPLFLMSAAIAGWTIWEQKYHSLALGPEWDISLAARFAIAGKAVWFYLGKLAWPFPLVFVYPRWNPDSSWAALVPLLSALAGLAILGLMRRKGRCRGLFFATIYFVVLLFPVLGFFNVYYFRYSFVADHFQYLASMGPLVLVGCALANVLSPIRARPTFWLVSVAAGLLAALGTATAIETRKFANADALWQSTIDRNPSCWMAYTMLGITAGEKGQVETAFRLHERAIQLNPRCHEAHYNIGLEWVKKGDIDRGIAEYQRALALKPDFPDAENNLGLAYAMSERPTEAVEHYGRALRMDPYRAKTHFAMALSLTERGRTADASEHYRQAIILKPDYAEAHYGFAQLLQAGGRVSDAIMHDRAAVESDPKFAAAWAHLGIVLYLDGKVRESVAALRQALAIEPNNAQVRRQYAMILLSAGAAALAIPEFEAVLKVQPNDAHARYDLARALRATGRNEDSAEQERLARQTDPSLPALATEAAERH